MAKLLEEGKQLCLEDRDGSNDTVLDVEVKVLQIIESDEGRRYYKIEIRDSEGSVVHWLPKTVFSPDGKGWKESFCPEEVDNILIAAL